MAGRVLILVAAVVVAAVGVLVVVLYANNAEDDAQESLELTEVLVVASQVDTGTSFAEARADGSIVEAQRQAGDLPPGAVSDVADLEGRVALTTLYPGEIVIAPKVGDPGDVTALPPPASGLAASFNLEAPQRVAGFLRPGSEVAVYATVEQPVVGAAEGEAATALTTDLLVRDVEVLAVGTSAVDDAGAPVEGDVALVTLAVDPGELQKLLFAQRTGTLHLALLGENPLIEDMPGTTRENLFRETP